MNNMADESMTRPMTPAQQAQMLDEEADFYVRYNGAKSDEHRWVQSLRAGAVSLRQSVADAQAMSNLLAANRILLNRAERTEQAEDDLYWMQDLINTLKEEVGDSQNRAAALTERLEQMRADRQSVTVHSEW